MKSFIAAAWWLMLLCLVCGIALGYVLGAYSSGELDLWGALFCGVPAFLIFLLLSYEIGRKYSLYCGKRSQKRDKRDKSGPGEPAKEAGGKG